MDPTSHNRRTYDTIASLYRAQNDQPGVTRWFPPSTGGLLDRLPPGAKVGDLACGPGVDGRWWSGAGFNVVGLDLSAGMLRSATQDLPGRVAQADLRALPLATAALDAVWCAAALLHVPIDDTVAVLFEFHRVLRPAGTLALVTALGEGIALEPVAYDEDSTRWVVYRRADEVLTAVRSAGFTVLRSDEQPGSRQWLTVLAEAR